VNPPSSDLCNNVALWRNRGKFPFSKHLPPLNQALLCLGDNGEKFPPALRLFLVWPM
jgi:hypothetical protein